MFNYYQPSLLPFLSLKRAKPLPGIKCYYYHSFEDSLWDLLQNKFPNTKKLLVLVPDFYCSDVLDNLKSHNCDYIYYPLDKNFQISAAKFKKYLWLFCPDVAIIFHACGITSTLMKDTSWLADLPAKTLIVEDCVHRLVNPQNINFLNDRHYVIDSLRKVSPLPGSRMFGKSKALNFQQQNSKYATKYFLTSTFCYLLFRIILNIGFLIKSSKLIIYSHEHVLKVHDDIVGDSTLPQRGIPWMSIFYNRLNYQKVAQVKNALVNKYEECLSSIYNRNYFYHINIPNVDYKELHVYPVGINGSDSSDLISYLHARNIPVWCKFTDVPWSQNRQVLFLPLGFHINTAQITHLKNALAAWHCDKI
jgi:hypothetical protein